MGESDRTLFQSFDPKNFRQYRSTFVPPKERVKRVELLIHPYLRDVSVQSEKLAGEEFFPK